MNPESIQALAGDPRVQVILPSLIMSRGLEIARPGARDFVGAVSEHGLDSFELTTVCEAIYAHVTEE
jgi:hypothetical protein